MRWIEATRNFDPKKKKVVSVIVSSLFFLQSRREFGEEKSLIFFLPSRFLQRVGTRPKCLGFVSHLYLHIEVVVVFL